MNSNYTNNNIKVVNNNTIIFVNTDEEKERVIRILFDLDISSYLIDDTYRDRVIIRETVSNDFLEDLVSMLCPDDYDDFDSIPFLSDLYGYISGRENFSFDRASYHGIFLSQFA